MNLLSAAALVVWATGRNRLRRQVQRLREPRYAVATAFGALYFWTLFFRRFTSFGRGGHAPEWSLPAWELGACALAYLGLASNWLFGGEEGALRFTEAEVQFFFPAPASRAGLIRYKLARTLVVTAISALLTTLFLGWRLTAHWGCFLLGQWIAMTALSLHTSAASLTRASLAEHGLSGLKRQAIVLVAAVGIGAYAYLHLDAIAAPEWTSVRSIAAWCRTLLVTPPTGILLFPVRALFDVAFASSWGAALAALPAALAVLGVHYLWLVRSDTAFEEASIEMAQRTAARVAAWRAGRGIVAVRQVRPPFALGGMGHREVALLWKNAVAIVRAYSLRLVLIVVYLAIATTLLGWTLLQTRSDLRWAMGAFLSVMLAGYLMLLGPLVLRWDFRQDLAQVDLLRAWPMSGRQVVLGEVLAPIAALTLGQWGALALAALFNLGIDLPELGLGPRLALLGAAALLMPGITLCTLVLQNGAALLFPNWVGPTRQVRGIEAIGQRLLTFAANLVALLGALIPASAVGGLVLLTLWWLLHWTAAPVAAGAAAAVMLVEAYAAIGWLGGVFERFDLTE